MHKNKFRKQLTYNFKYTGQVTFLNGTQYINIILILEIIHRPLIGIRLKAPE